VFVKKGTTTSSNSKGENKYTIKRPRNLTAEGEGINHPTTININNTQNIHINNPTHIQLTINNPVMTAPAAGETPTTIGAG
jgi:hypothetical protein